MTNQYPPNIQKFIDEMKGTIGEMFLKEIIESERRKAVMEYDAMLPDRVIYPHERKEALSSLYPEK